MEEKKQKMNVIVPLLVIALVGGAFYIGRLTQKIESLSKSSVSGTQVGAVPSAAPDPGLKLSVENLKQEAKSLGLNSDQFNQCMDTGKYAQKVSDDTAYGAKVGVSGTPSFFINKTMVVGAYPVNVFEDIIDFELAGGNWNNPTAKVKTLVDKDDNNGEVIPNKTVVTGKGYVRGSATAPIKIVEFGDFQCPYCVSAYPTLKALEEKYGDKISLEFRSYPLPFHPYAQKASEAAECAGEQGKFWEMHDRMYEAQQAS